MVHSIQRCEKPSADGMNRRKEERPRAADYVAERRRTCCISARGRRTRSGAQFRKWIFELPKERPDSPGVGLSRLPRVRHHYAKDELV